jgi:hypothetical protein
MIGRRNKFIAGDYEGFRVKARWSGVKLSPPLKKKKKDKVVVDRYSIRGYELVTSDHRKSVASTIIRGMIGKYLLGLVGLIGGTASAKNTGLYTVSLQFTSGERSLIEVDDKVYKAIIKVTY